MSGAWVDGGAEVTSPDWEFGRPYGTGIVFVAFPALKRWATFGRPYGTLVFYGRAYFNSTACFRGKSLEDPPTRNVYEPGTNCHPC